MNRRQGRLRSRSPSRARCAIDVGFLRAEERFRCVRVAAEDRLAPDNHELGFAHDLGRGGDYVMQVLTAHR
jgi:hypothetical protein